MAAGAACDDDALKPSPLHVATAGGAPSVFSQWQRLWPPRARPVANPRTQTLHLWSSHLGSDKEADVPAAPRILFLPLLPAAPAGRSPRSMSRLVAVSRSCTVNWCQKCGGGVIPRHWRSGWHRMWPNSAFHDGNRLPHSVHGGVSSPVGDDRTRATPPPSGESARTTNAGGGSGSARDSVSIVSWWGAAGSGSGCGGRRAGAAAAGRTGVAMANHQGQGLIDRGGWATREVEVALAKGAGAICNVRTRSCCGGCRLDGRRRLLATQRASWTWKKTPSGLPLPLAG